MRRDPHGLTGKSEAELADAAKRRMRCWATQSFMARVWKAKVLFSALVAVIIATVVAFSLNEPVWVMKLGTIWIVLAVVMEFRITSIIRDENLAAIAETIRLQMPRVAEVEASKALRNYDPDARVRTLSGGDAMGKLPDKLSTYEAPFSLLEAVILSFGTILTGFGDWITCSIFQGQLSRCLPAVQEMVNASY